LKSGVVAVYDATYSDPSSGNSGTVDMTLTVTVDSVVGDTVSGTNVVSSPMAPGEDEEYTWTCYAYEACGGRFWMDPNDLKGSIDDTTGEIFTAEGSGKSYSHGSISTTDGSLFTFDDSRSSTTAEIMLHTSTGILLDYSEIYGSAKTTMHLRSLNFDLKDYEPQILPPPSNQQNLSSNITFNPGEALPKIKMPSCTSSFILVIIGFGALAFTRIK